jgi:hypothetical protein
MPEPAPGTLLNVRGTPRGEFSALRLRYENPVSGCTPDPLTTHVGDATQCLTPE